MSVAYFAKKVGNRYEVKCVNGYVMPDHEDSIRIFKMMPSGVEGEEFLEILKLRVITEMYMAPKAVMLWLCKEESMQEF